MRILAADFGTSSVKTGIYDENLREYAGAKAIYNYQVKGLESQIDPNVIWAGFIECLHRLGDAARDIDVVAIANFSPSVIPMDKDGNALYDCIIHLDRRSYDQSRQAMGLVGQARFLEINGNLPFSGGISLTSIMWLMQNEPEVSFHIKNGTMT